MPQYFAAAPPLSAPFPPLLPRLRGESPADLPADGEGQENQGLQQQFGPPGQNEGPAGNSSADDSSR